MYREKISQRMEIFGLDQASLKPKSDRSIAETDLPTKQTQTSGATGVDETNEIEVANDQQLDEPTNKENPAASNNNPFFKGAIAQIIFNAAIKGPNKVCLACPFAFGP